MVIAADADVLEGFSFSLSPLQHASFACVGQLEGIVAIKNITKIK